MFAVNVAARQCLNEFVAQGMPYVLQYTGDSRVKGRAGTRGGWPRAELDGACGGHLLPPEILGKKLFLLGFELWTFSLQETI